MLIQLRGKAKKKGIKPSDLFLKLDTNKDGFLDINEFSEGLSQLVDVSQVLKEGLFVYLDNMHIGLVD